MGYCSIEDVKDLVKDNLFNAILGDEYIDEDDAEAMENREENINLLIENAITDADAEINGYLSKRYKLPFQDPPAVLKKFSKDIAAYNLVSRIGIDEQDRDKTYLNRYNAAIKFLTMVAEGKIDIGAYTPEVNSAVGFRMNSSNRIFSRDSMRGW